MNSSAHLNDVFNAQKSQKDNEAQARDIGMTAAVWSSMYAPAGAVITSVFLANAVELYNRAITAEPSKRPMAKTYFENAAISAGMALVPILFGSMVIAAFLHARRNYLSNAAQAYRDQLAPSV